VLRVIGIYGRFGRKDVQLVQVARDNQVDPWEHTAEQEQNMSFWEALQKG